MHIDPAAEPERARRAWETHLARARWIQVVEPRRFTTKELSGLIRTAYGLIRAKLTKKLQAQLGEWPLPKEQDK